MGWQRKYSGHGYLNTWTPTIRTTSGASISWPIGSAEWRQIGSQVVANIMYHEWSTSASDWGWNDNYEWHILSLPVPVRQDPNFSSPGNSIIHDKVIGTWKQANWVNDGASGLLVYRPAVGGAYFQSFRPVDSGGYQHWSYLVPVTNATKHSLLKTFFGGVGNLQVNLRYDA